ncbi:nitroreductase [Xylariomycetidae sp. FL2044]|nr:nitroreductase [Xylariomycetidae sp. FL2044]
MSAFPSLTQSFLDAAVTRRSTIGLHKASTISDGQVEEIVKHALLYTPTPFNVQATRAVVLFGADHEKLWDMVAVHARNNYPPEAFEAFLAPNIKATKASYGTILFYEDPAAIDAMPPRSAGLLKTSPEWFEQANGMAQFYVWTAFTSAGLGASIQHYQKGGLTEQIAKEWDLPASWDLKCQMPFGTPAGPPRGGDKQFAPIEPRIKVFGGEK